ncbi:hypothetical protein ACI7BZ_02720 [Xanthobacter sp. AM11]|uniref:hypothetical protein n=1 Tax=Xanthobacter sp. AM11 TaxID=3380643 RepID=UPI0039BF307A
MLVIRVLLRAGIATALLLSVVLYPEEAFQVFGSAIAALSTAGSITFFVFVAIAAVAGLERTTGRHLAPAAAVPVNRSVGGDV